MVPIIVVLKNKKRSYGWDVVGNRIRRNNRLAKKYLSQAKSKSTIKSCFTLRSKKMHNFLKAKLNIETTERARLISRDFII
jgi:hypothetical protein